MRLFVVSLTVFCALPVVQAQDTAACSTQTIRGTYAVSCSGWMSPAAGAPQAQFSVLGTVTSDYAGNVAGSSKVSIGGQVVDESVTTASNTLNSDCTGTIVYDQKINGQPAGKVNISYHVLDDGKEIRGMMLDPGATILCNMRRIRK